MTIGKAFATADALDMTERRQRFLDAWGMTAGELDITERYIATRDALDRLKTKGGNQAFTELASLLIDCLRNKTTLPSNLADFWASALEKTIAKESAKDRATTLAKELGLKFSRRIAGVYEVAHFILPLLDTDFMHGHGDTKKGLSLGDSYLKAAEHFGCDERTIETIWSEYKKVSNHNEMVRLLEASMGRYRRRRFRVDYKVQTSFKVVQYQHYMLERVRRFHYRH